jgi:hypothetical protein
MSQAQTQNVGSVDRVGTTAAQFLKIGAGARAIGMGSAYTAIANDILAVYWNPAGLSRVNRTGEAIFNHASWLADTKYNFAAVSLNLSTVGSIGLQVISFSTPEQPVRTIANPDGDGRFWDATAFTIGVTYARNLTERFSIGLTAKFISERIFNASANGAAFDLGIMFNTPLDNLVLGASISNFGTKMRLEGRDLRINHDPVPVSGSVDAVPAEYLTESFNIPLNLKFGLAYNAIKNEDYSLLVALDGIQASDNSPSLNTGFEVGFKNILFLRGGYKSLLIENSEESFTFGAGLQYDIVGTNVKFDFGWADFGRLENVQFVSLAIRY